MSIISAADNPSIQCGTAFYPKKTTTTNVGDDAKQQTNASIVITELVIYILLYINERKSNYKANAFNFIENGNVPYI